MKLKVSVKQAGKKHALIDAVPFEVNNCRETCSLEELLTAIVIQQVREFNRRNRDDEETLLPWLTDDEIAEKLKSGKVTFDIDYNSVEAGEEEAIKNALLSFQDGLYAVFIDDREYRKLDETVNVTEESILTFIRLTFLAGSWF